MRCWSSASTSPDTNQCDRWACPLMERVEAPVNLRDRTCWRHLTRADQSSARTGQGGKSSEQARAVRQCSGKEVKPPFPAAYPFFCPALAQPPAHPGSVLSPWVYPLGRFLLCEPGSGAPEPSPQAVLRGNPTWVGFRGAWRAHEIDALAMAQTWGAGFSGGEAQQAPQVVLGAEARWLRGLYTPSP